MNTENLTSVETEEVGVEDKPTLKRTAVKAIKRGSQAAKQAADNVVLVPVKAVNHAVYGVCYGLAYGAVYGALVVSKVFPEDGAVRKGLHEGLESAVKDFDAKQHEIVIEAESSIVNA